MISRFSIIGKAVIILGLTAFLFLGIFGMSHSTMNMGPDGSMTTSNCPFMSGQAVFCNMNPFQHIAAWQSIFVTAFPQNGSDLLVLFLAVLALAFVWSRFLWPRQRQYLQKAFYVLLRPKESFLVPLLQQLLSRGILNPKIF